MVRLDNSTTIHTQVGTVNDADSTKVLKGQGGSAEPVSGGSVQRPTGDSSSVSANVSSAGSAVAAATAGSDVRTDKVAALQAAIANGTYNVPAGAVADKLIASLLGTQ